MLTKKTKLKKYFGDSPTLRIIDFLLDNETESYNFVEIMKKAKVGYSTCKIILPRLLKLNIVKIDRIIGKSKLYKINKKAIKKAVEIK